MGEAKRKREAPDGVGSGTDRGPMGASGQLPPPSNTGGKAETGGGERNRINLSLPVGVYQALDMTAEKLGMPLAQVALGALMAGMPAVAAELEACVRMAREESW